MTLPGRPGLNRRKVLLGVGLALSQQAAAQPAGALNVRDFGARGDGVTDDTAALRAVHAMGRPVWYPATSKFYRLTGKISVSGDVRGDGARLHCLQDGLVDTAIFEVSDNKAPLVISGLQLSADSPQTKAQWSPSILLAGASDVTISGVTMTTPHGDCVYLGVFDHRQPCRRIRIVDNVMTDPYRCCVAAVCVEGAVIERNVMRKASAFVSVIDLEPNPNGFDRVTDVKILDNRVDTVGRFVQAGKFNGIPTSGVEIRNNVGRASEVFFKSKSARVPDLVLEGNNIQTDKS